MPKNARYCHQENSNGYTLGRLFGTFGYKIMPKHGGKETRQSGGIGAQERQTSLDQA
jgi:hypothetical protein